MSQFVQGNLFINIKSAKDLANTDEFFTGKSDPYVQIQLDDKKIARTNVIDNELCPVWNYEVWVNVHGPFNNLLLIVNDYDNFDADDELGRITIPLSALEGGQVIEGDKALSNVPDKKKYSTLNVKIQYFPLNWEVPGVPFAARPHCKMTLYQSAHVDEGDIPPLFGCKDYEHGKCWEDIFRSILHAEQFIYITGWSVNVSISLLRRNPIFRADGKGGFINIGELLKMKAEEGVTVLVHLWNEKSSLGSDSIGLMGTGDEKTRAFFENTKVKCCLSYRQSKDAGGEWVWTHHQKSVIVDAESNEEGKRRVIAYVGGLDLCDGRWDTPKKFLYRSLRSLHKDDFHQVWPDISSPYGPRQPWQDIHSRVEGPIARDVMTNFEQRWIKQHPSHQARLIKLNPSKFIQVEQEEFHDNTSWTIQLLRSIDESSIHMNGIDKSIQSAYVNAIRRADRFIYIENQYFMGSSPYWLNNQNAGCNNEIPNELVKRIEFKISKGKEFAVYIVLPVFPEGVPTDGAVQEILFWQSRTMQMMYHRIAKAIEKAGLSGKRTPYDYLNFFCLGARETIDRSEADPCSPTAKGYQKLLDVSRRYQIYVHSKMMIVDDVYIIVGSANINERSMAGDRDTEIAVGAFQTFNKDSKDPKEVVHRFRMSLWAEHIGESVESHVTPEKLETVREIRKLADRNWALFAAESVVDLDSHLMSYPIDASNDGSIKARCQYFPDTTASVIGSESTLLFDKLTQ